MNEHDLTGYTDDLANALCAANSRPSPAGRPCSHHRHIAEQVIASPALTRIVAAAEQRGRDEVRARVEAVLRSSWVEVRTHGDAARKIRAALADPEPDA